MKLGISEGTKQMEIKAVSQGRETAKHSIHSSFVRLFIDELGHLLSAYHGKIWENIFIEQPVE